MKKQTKKSLKIAFIAMSGIRVVGKELLEMGLTLPGFVERSKVIASLPSLGLLTLAGMTPERHEKRYIEMDDLMKNNLQTGEIFFVLHPLQTVGAGFFL